MTRQAAAATAVETGGTRPPSLLLLSLASSLSPFGMSILFPALAGIAGMFGIGLADAQYLIAIYLFGLGLGQPIAGVVADRVGRRPVMLAGFALFTFSSIACVLTSSFALLVALRFLQALGVSVGTVVSRAVVRDCYDALGSARALSWIGAGMGVAPMIGPVIGGSLSGWINPLAIFGASAVLGVVVSAALAVWLPETRPRDIAAEPGTRSWHRVSMELLRSPMFLGHTLLYAFTQGSFFAFLAVGAAVFDEHMQIGPQRFGVIWGGMSAVYVAAAAVAARLTARIGPDRLLGASTLAAAAAAWIMVSGVLLAGVTPAGVLVPIAVLMAAAGIQTPLSIAGVVNVRPGLSGTAAGLSSSLALALSGAFSIVSGTFYSGSFLVIALIMASAATLAFLAWRITTRT